MMTVATGPLLIVVNGNEAVKLIAEEFTADGASVMLPLLYCDSSQSICCSLCIGSFSLHFLPLITESTETSTEHFTSINTHITSVLDLLLHKVS